MENFLQQYNLDHWLLKFIIIISIIIIINVITRIVLNFLKDNLVKLIMFGMIV